jgi:hypothetical protein
MIYVGARYERMRSGCLRSLAPPAVVRMITPPTGNTVQTTEGYYDVEVSEHHQHLFTGANTKPRNILNDSLQYTFASQNIRTKSLYIYIQTEHTHIKY